MQKAECRKRTARNPRFPILPFCILHFAFCIAAPEASGQHAPHVIPSVPQTLLERPVTLRTNIGVAHDDVGTASTEAQAFYDQGLAYLHSYVWIEAARSFHQALRSDPNLALAHVGLSYAYLELSKTAQARQAIATAQRLAVAAGDHVKRHVAARALQMAAEDAPRDTAKLAAYRQALDEAIAAHPNDVELLLLRGMAESPDPADRGQGSVAGSLPFYERALKVSANHFGARHFMAHAYENSGRMKDAVDAALSYSSQASAVPHARHMYGHELRRIGRVAEAIAQFEAADKLQREYFAAEKIGAEYDWHHQHNLDLLAASYQYVGQMRKAEALLEQSFALPTSLLVQAVNKREWPAFLLARSRAPEAYAAAQALVKHPHPVVQATGYIEAAFALLAMNRPGDAAPTANAALKALRAAQKWRSLPGPDAWTQALFRLEALARAARQVGDWSFAARLTQLMLEHDPDYAGTHYALGLVAHHDGNMPTARREFELAAKAWAGADKDLAELKTISDFRR